MAAVLKTMYNLYYTLFYEVSDPRTSNWILVGSPLPVIALISFYVYFVQKIGIEYMKDKKPYNVDRVIQVYNAVQVILCFWFSVEAFINCYGPTGLYSWKCEPVDYSYSPNAMKVARFVYGYYLIKIVDLLDTVFFVLRKKNSQITFLHIYHHAGMVLLGYVGTKFLPGGHGVFLGMINCIVHSVMYSYYFITNYNPEYKKKIWWKKHITQMQILQFMAIIFHFTKILFQENCNYPKWAVCLFLPQNFFMLLLFLDFYKKAYLSPKKPITPSSKVEEESSSFQIADKEKAF
ncbi:elongation of very long chain fatty acids protein, putative [Pediculus humanus corporis]|uniref:Elongation of very long chain fatty acids protein n=1 Tax=Pediculus humanus subsp. corporis TaxID=121224 RepID=E0VQR4_PEDHC|nr:elongation of very long chain fatty acids protein, putative [Pediculus humanus corporis]EEB15719.1 elongation of very long chain fatty acids protein, putative [Pediculus humanus corporis]